MGPAPAHIIRLSNRSRQAFLESLGGTELMIILWIRIFGFCVLGLKSCLTADVGSK